MNDWRNQNAFQDIFNLNEEDLKKYIENEWGRAKELDDKLSKLTVTLSIALTIGGALAKTAVDSISWEPGRIVLVLFLTASMLFLLAGALVGFNGLVPKPRYGYGPRFLNQLSAGDAERRSAMEYAACGFETTNAVRANETMVAVSLIRNGVLIFAIAMIATLTCSSLKPSPPPMQPYLKLAGEIGKEAFLY